MHQIRKGGARNYWYAVSSKRGDQPSKLQEAHVESTVIAIDVGNTATRFGIARKGKLHATWETRTSLAQTPDEACLALHGFLNALEIGIARTVSDEEEGLADFTSATPAGGIVSSVVPSLTAVWAQAVERLCKKRPFIVGPGLKTGLRMAYNDPSEIGADRVADMVAARDTYGNATLVIDMGTSTTFELLNNKGEFAGGIIAPGLKLSANALASAAARLPMVEIKAPASIIGQSTREAMQSGIVMGEIARIDGLIDMIWKEAGYETNLVLSGQDAEAISRLLTHEVVVDQTLTLRGLVALYENNRRR